MKTKSTPKIDNQILRVCCVCYPGLTVFDDYPWLRYNFGDNVSHGYCEFHAFLFRLSILSSQHYGRN